MKKLTILLIGAISIILSSCSKNNEHEVFCGSLEFDQQPGGFFGLPHSKKWTAVLVDEQKSNKKSYFIIKTVMFDSLRNLSLRKVEVCGEKVPVGDEGVFFNDNKDWKERMPVVMTIMK